MLCYGSVKPDVDDLIENKNLIDLSCGNGLTLVRNSSLQLYAIGANADDVPFWINNPNESKLTTFYKARSNYALVVACDDTSSLVNQFTQTNCDPIVGLDPKVFEFWSSLKNNLISMGYICGKDFGFVSNSFGIFFVRAELLPEITNTTKPYPSYVSCSGSSNKNSGFYRTPGILGGRMLPEFACRHQLCGKAPCPGDSSDPYGINSVCLNSYEFTQGGDGQTVKYFCGSRPNTWSDSDGDDLLFFNYDTTSFTNQLFKDTKFGSFLNAVYNCDRLGNETCTALGNGSNSTWPYQPKPEKQSSTCTSTTLSFLQNIKEKKIYYTETDYVCVSMDCNNTDCSQYEDCDS
jgi:hypothetical protein